MQQSEEICSMDGASPLRGVIPTIRYLLPWVIRNGSFQIETTSEHSSMAQCRQRKQRKLGEHCDTAVTSKVTFSK